MRYGEVQKRMPTLGSPEVLEGLGSTNTKADGEIRRQDQSGFVVNVSTGQQNLVACWPFKPYVCIGLGADRSIVRDGVVVWFDHAAARAIYGVSQPSIRMTDFANT
jgi:hypothetical protein